MNTQGKLAQVIHTMSIDATDNKNLVWLWPVLGAVGVVLAMMVAFGITMMMKDFYR